jgi:hypothetical protein
MPKRTWGFLPEEWTAARSEMSRVLAEVAGVRSTVTYGEMARRAFDGRVSARSGALMDMLGEVDSDASAELGIMIASLVVRADSGIPGDGYFVFAAEELGRPLGDRRAFWEHEVERVWDAYAPGASPTVSAAQLAAPDSRRLAAMHEAGVR